MQNQTLRIPDICQMERTIGYFEYFYRASYPPFTPKTTMPPNPFSNNFTAVLYVGSSGKARIPYPGDFRMLF